jgi:hypothetical protein
MDPARMFKESLTPRPELENLRPERQSRFAGGEDAYPPDLASIVPVNLNVFLGEIAGEQATQPRRQGLCCYSPFAIRHLFCTNTPMRTIAARASGITRAQTCQAWGILGQTSSSTSQPAASMRSAM